MNDKLRMNMIAFYSETGILCILVVILAIVLMGETGGNRRKDVKTEQLSGEVRSSEESQETKKESGREERKEKAQKIYKKNKALLVLVNKENQVPKDYDAKLIEICNGRLRASQLLYDDLKKMLNDADREGYSFLISSAYRSAEKQQSLVDEDVEAFMQTGLNYNEALKETLKETMPAGYSEHQTGLALDILSSDNMEMNSSQEKSLGNQWLRSHCAEYGFILRYPKDKTEVTKISYEPWHFRYVGREAAKFMVKNDITLEEFMEMAEN